MKKRKKTKAQQVWDRIFPFVVGDILLFDPNTTGVAKFEASGFRWKVVKVDNEMIHLVQITDNPEHGGLEWDIFNRPDHPLTRKFVRVGHEDAV